MSGAKLNVPQCDQAAWRMFGISMAGYNTVISLGLAVLSVLAVRQERDHG
jgi:disulfide bond formation protein DsbB